ncbi:MAG: sigma-70 family RNA polymerase sigma factor [Pseudomonadota bacterium]
MNDHSDNGAQAEGDVAEQLVARIAQGDQSAEQALVQRYRRGLLFVLRMRCSDPGKAEEVAQDTLMSVILKARAGLIQKPRTLKAYLRSTGQFRLIDEQRKDDRRKTSPASEIVEQAAAASPSLLDMVDQTRIAQWVRDILEELKTPRDRDLLRRFFLYGEEKTTLTREFEVTPAHFDRVKSRALSRLQKVVKAHLKSKGMDPQDILCIALIASALAWLAIASDSPLKTAFPYIVDGSTEDTL